MKVKYEVYKISYFYVFISCISAIATVDVNFIATVDVNLRSKCQDIAGKSFHSFKFKFLRCSCYK